jgi:hypothetical protein
MGTRRRTGLRNIFNRIIAENCSNPKKQMPIQLQEASDSKQRRPNRTSPHDIVDKTLSTKNKERILKLQKRSTKSPIKANPSE